MPSHRRFVCALFLLALVPSLAWADGPEGVLGAALAEVGRRLFLTVGFVLELGLLVGAVSSRRRGVLGFTFLVGSIVMVGAIISASHYWTWLSGPTVSEMRPEWVSENRLLLVASVASGTLGLAGVVVAVRRLKKLSANVDRQ